MTETPDLPAAGFDPRMKELLLRASREAFELPCASFEEATAFRRALNSFRARFKKARHEGWEVLYRAVISLETGSSTLHFRPRDFQFDHLLEKAVGGPMTLNSDPLDHLDEGSK